MFARGNWAVFGVNKASLKKFRKNLNSDLVMLDLSQLGASIKAKYLNQQSFGINPFGVPRKDEKLNGGFSTDLLVKYFGEPSDVRQLFDDSEIETLSVAFGRAEEFELPDPGVAGIESHYYGFWFVINDQEDVTDPASKKEGLSYSDMEKPFKFLNKDEKKAVEQQVKTLAVPARKQFPVLVDFADERVYVESSSKDDVLAVQELLIKLGADVFALAWQFDGYDWTSRFINKVNNETKFEKEMAERADELSRFLPEEVATLDDKMMESIVSTFFALSELETGDWCGLTTPARVRLYPTTDPATVANVSTAFSLLRVTDKASVASAALIFQSLDSKIIKKTDEEKQFRKDLFTIDINDNVNLSDAGAAMLRGFDMPQFKKDIKAALKAQEAALSIGEYWKNWLQSMREAVYKFTDNVTETLQIDKSKYGMKPYASDEQKAETVEVE